MSSNHERDEKGERAKASHTPGPWAVRSRDIGGFVVGPTASFLPVSIIPKNKRDDTEVHANANLIAAAPDLLEALKMARECIAYCLRAHKDAQSGEGIPVEVFIDAAIRKATGA